MKEKYTIFMQLGENCAYLFSHLCRKIKHFTYIEIYRVLIRNNTLQLHLKYLIIRIPCAKFKTNSKLTRNSWNQPGSTAGRVLFGEHRVTHPRQYTLVRMRMSAFHKKNIRLAYFFFPETLFQTGRHILSRTIRPINLTFCLKHR